MANSSNTLDYFVRADVRYGEALGRALVEHRDLGDPSKDTDACS
jgi:hypothetical protein